MQPQLKIWATDGFEMERHEQTSSVVGLALRPLHRLLKEDPHTYILCPWGFQSFYNVYPTLLLCAPALTPKLKCTSTQSSFSVIHLPCHHNIKILK